MDKTETTDTNNHNEISISTGLIVMKYDIHSFIGETGTKFRISIKEHKVQIFKGDKYFYIRH